MLNATFIKKEIEEEKQKAISFGQRQWAIEEARQQGRQTIEEIIEEKEKERFEEETWAQPVDQFVQFGRGAGEERRQNRVKQRRAAAVRH